MPKQFYDLGKTTSRLKHFETRSSSLVKTYVFILFLDSKQNGDELLILQRRVFSFLLPRKRVPIFNDGPTFTWTILSRSVLRVENVFRYNRMEKCCGQKKKT